MVRGWGAAVPEFAGITMLIVRGCDASVLTFAFLYLPFSTPAGDPEYGSYHGL